MDFLRYVFTNPPDFATGDQIFPKICHFARVRHLSGKADAEITFAAQGAIAQMIVSPGGTPYPLEIQMQSKNGWDRVRVASVGVPDAVVEVTAWT